MSHKEDGQSLDDSTKMSRDEYMTSKCILFFYGNQ